MTIDPKDCWDCPVNFWVVLAWLLLAIAAVGLGFIGTRHRKLPVRILSSVAIALGGFWYAAVAVYVPRWGIDWNPGSTPWSPVVLPARQNAVFWSAHLAMLSVIAFSLVRLRRAHA